MLYCRKQIISSVLGEDFNIMLGGGQHTILANTEWSYERHGTKILCDRETNEKIEMAYYKDEPIVHVCLHGEDFVIDLMTKSGRGEQTGEHIILTRKWLGSSADQTTGYYFEFVI